MTYKAIIENMARTEATRKAEKMMNDNGVAVHWLEVEEIKTMKDIDFGISFEIVADIIGENFRTTAKVEISGYIDECGAVEVCTIWKRTPDATYLNGYNSTMIWSVAGDRAEVNISNNWELLK